MKICIVVPHFLPHVGGGELLWYDIAKGLQNEGHEVRVITSSSGMIQGNKDYQGINTYYYPWILFCGHPIVKARDIKPHIQWADIVHTTMFTTATKTRCLSKKYKKPCILTIYEVLGNKWFWFETSKFKAALFKLYELMLCTQHFTAFHAISGATKRDYNRFCGKNRNVTKIYCGVDVPKIDEIRKEKINIKEYFGLKNDDKCFLYFGRPAPNKGVFVLEEAINKLNNMTKLPKNIKFCWLLAKDPEEQREKLLDLMEKHHITDRVVIKPSVKRHELFKIIIEADWIIVPSITEGFGFSAAEACSLGSKIIYSSGGSLPEVVFGEALMFENRNAVDLAEKIYKVIQEGDRAFEYIPEKKFDKELMTREIIKLYKSVLKE